MAEYREADRHEAFKEYDGRAGGWGSAGRAETFAEIGRELKSFDPRSVVFYASGRASLETSYLHQLLARAYGSNNLPGFL